MAKMETYMFVAALVSVGLSGVLYLSPLTILARRRLSLSGVPPGASSEVTVAAQPAWDGGRLGTMVSVTGLLFLTLCIVSRGVVTGHGPFTNMYEYSLALAWGIVAAGLYFQWRYGSALIGATATPIAAAFLVYAYTLPSRPVPLVPALQQSMLLSFHVAVAIIASGFFALALCSALLYLIQHQNNVGWLPATTTLDDMGYRAMIIGFPFWTLMIVLGAFWADVAWGRYWGWDPKETASLVTWLMYAGYLHARTLRRWKGTRSAILLILGFAAVLFTYFGNYFFAGLHAY